MSAIAKHPSSPSLRDIEKGPYIRSPLHKQIGFPTAVTSGLGLSTGELRENTPSRSSYSAASSSAHSLGVHAHYGQSNPAWIASSPSKRPHRRHRRVDTSSLIAIMSKPVLTPTRVLSLFTIVATASYLGRSLPLFQPEPPVRGYNPSVVYHAADAYEPLRMEPPPAAQRYSHEDQGYGRRSPKAAPVAAPANGAHWQVYEVNHDPIKPVNSRPRKVPVIPVKKSELFDHVDPQQWHGKKQSSSQREVDEQDDVLSLPKSHIDPAPLNLVVVDGVDRAEHEAEKSVDDAALSIESTADDLQHRSSAEDLVVDEEAYVPDDEDEYVKQDDSATEDDEALVLDEEEDAAYSSPEDEEELINTPPAVQPETPLIVQKPRNLPLPLRGSNRAPGAAGGISHGVAGLMAARAKEASSGSAAGLAKKATIFEGLRRR